MTTEQLKEILYSYKWENLPLEDALNKIQNKTESVGKKLITNLYDVKTGNFYTLVNHKQGFSLRYKVGDVKKSISPDSDSTLWININSSTSTVKSTIKMLVDLKDPDWELWEC